jgi:hypothetical protein
MSSFISVFLQVRSLNVHLQLYPLASPDFTLIIFNLQYLEMREFEYDERAFVDFYTEDSPCTQAISVLVYIGSSNKSKNQYYLGPAPLEAMASQIAKAVGPAGPNYEYLFRLEESLYQIGALLSLLSPELLLNNQNMLCTVSILHLAMFFD